jgi:hypothetical protein
LGGEENLDVTVWAGEGDDRVPVEVSREMYGRYMRDRFKICEVKGHTSVIVRRGGEVVKWLTREEGGERQLEGE